jgi:hypothetical protein
MHKTLLEFPASTTATPARSSLVAGQLLSPR